MSGRGPREEAETLDGETTIVVQPPPPGGLGAECADESEPAPRFLGRYMVIERLGQGGMGTVFRAYDPKLDREVALKVLRRVTDDARVRLIREAQAMAQLSHPNVLPVYDVATEGHRLFLAMELVRGQNVRQWLDERPRAWSEVLEVFVAAGQGLQAAHEAGLVHRDFKPANILMGEDGRVRVMDFGLARGTAAGRSADVSLNGLRTTRSSSDGHGLRLLLAARRETSRDSSGELGALARWIDENVSLVTGSGPRSSDSHDLLNSLSEELTQMGTVIGTPAYMAPEQHLGRAADVRSDQYAFCVSLWEALYGVRPFRVKSGGDWYRAKTSRRLHADPERGVPRWLHAVVARGLSPRPSQRYESIPALLRALGRGQRRRRRRWVMALGGTLALGATAVAFGLGGEPRMPCAGGGNELVGVWDQARRAQLEGAIMATQTPLAADTWVRLDPMLRSYVARWQAARIDACEATYVRHEQSEAVMDARMQCLDERARGLRALVQTLATADGEAVERAVSAVGELPLIEQCADPQYLQGQAPPPREPEVAARVQALEQALARIKAQAQAGRSRAALPEARDALERARALDHRPVEVLAMLRLAQVQTDVGHYGDAERLYEQAYFLAQRDGLDTRRAQAAIALIDLLNPRLGRPQDAERWERFARAALESVHDPEILASYLNNAGLLAKGRSDYATAIELLEQALAQREQLHGPEHPRVASVLNNLALAHDAQGRSSEALDLHARALTMRERLLGPEHPHVATSLLNVSNIHKDRADYRRAADLLERAQAIYAGAYGPEHPHVAGCLVNRGALHEQLGEYDQALERYEAALVVLRQAQGEHHPNVAGTLANMGNVYRARGELERAHEHYQQALAIFERVLGPEDAMVTIVLINLGSLALDRNDYATAEAHTRRALEITTKTLGLDHPKIATIYGNLALVHAGRDEHSEALTLQLEAVRVRERALGGRHPETALAHMDVGRTRLALGRPEAAVESLEQAVDVLAEREDQVAAFHEARFLLARAQWDTGRPGEARRLAQQARAALRGLGPEHHEQVAEIDRWLRAHGAG